MALTFELLFSIPTAQSKAPKPSATLMNIIVPPGNSSGTKPVVKKYGAGLSFKFVSIVEIYSLKIKSWPQASNKN